MWLLLVLSVLRNSESYSHDEGALHHDIWETSLDYRDVRRHAPSFNRMETDEGAEICGWKVFATVWCPIFSTVVGLTELWLV